MPISKHELDRDWQGLSEDIDLEIATASPDKLPALGELIEKINDLLSKYRFRTKRAM